MSAILAFLQTLLAIPGVGRVLAALGGAFKLGGVYAKGRYDAGQSWRVAAANERERLGQERDQIRRSVQRDSDADVRGRLRADYERRHRRR